MLTAAAAWMMKSICNEVIHKVSVMEPEITKNALDKQYMHSGHWMDLLHSRRNEVMMAGDSD